jgi:hypothetical protein
MTIVFFKERKEAREQMVSPGLKVYYDHCFFKERKEAKEQMVAPGLKV